MQLRPAVCNYIRSVEEVTFERVVFGHSSATQFFDRSGERTVRVSLTDPRLTLYIRELVRPTMIEQTCCRKEHPHDLIYLICGGLDDSQYITFPPRKMEGPMSWSTSSTGGGRLMDLF